jgi:hypothetical protein
MAQDPMVKCFKALVSWRILGNRREREREREREIALSITLNGVEKKKKKEH